jgi:hypothetical protein
MRVISDKLTSTNSQGEYEFSDVIPGRYHAWCFGNPQYAANSLEDDAFFRSGTHDHAVGEGQTVTLNHTVAPKANVSGHLTGIDRIPGSQVYQRSAQPVADSDVLMDYSNSLIIDSAVPEEIPTYNTHAYWHYLRDSFDLGWDDEDWSYEHWDWYSGGPASVRTDANGDFMFQHLGPNIINLERTPTNQEIDVKFGVGGMTRFPHTPVVVWGPQVDPNFSSDVLRDQIRMVPHSWGSFNQTLPAGTTNDPDISQFISKRLSIDGPDVTYDANLLKYSALNYGFGTVVWGFDGPNGRLANDPTNMGGRVFTSCLDGNNLGAVVPWYDHQNLYGGNRLWTYWACSGDATSNGATFSTKVRPYGQNNWYNTLIPTLDAGGTPEPVEFHFVGVSAPANSLDKFLFRIRAYDKHSVTYGANTYILYRQLPDDEIDIDNLHIETYLNRGPDAQYLRFTTDFDIANSSSPLTPPLEFTARKYDIFHSTNTGPNGESFPNSMLIPPPVNSNIGQENNSAPAVIYVNPNPVQEWHESYEVRPWPYRQGGYEFYFRPSGWSIGQVAWFNQSADWSGGTGGYECNIPMLKVGTAHFFGMVVDSSGNRLNGENGRPQAQILATLSGFPDQTILTSPGGSYDYDVNLPFVPVPGFNVRFLVRCPGYQDTQAEYETWDGFQGNLNFHMLLNGENLPPRHGDL